MASSKCNAGSLSPLPCRDLEKLHKIQSASRPQNLWRGPGLVTLHLQVEVWGSWDENTHRAGPTTEKLAKPSPHRNSVRGSRIVTRAAGTEAVCALNPWSNGRRSRLLLPGWEKPASSESSTGREHPKWSCRNLTFTQNCHCTDKKHLGKNKRKWEGAGSSKGPFPREQALAF